MSGAVIPASTNQASSRPDTLMRPRWPSRRPAKAKLHTVVACHTRRGCSPSAASSVDDPSAAVAGVARRWAAVVSASRDSRGSAGDQYARGDMPTVAVRDIAHRNPL